MLGGVFGVGALALAARRKYQEKAHQKDVLDRFSAAAARTFLSASEQEAKKSSEGSTGAKAAPADDGVDDWKKPPEVRIVKPFLPGESTVVYALFVLPLFLRSPRHRVQLQAHV